MHSIVNIKYLFNIKVNDDGEKKTKASEAIDSRAKRGELNLSSDK